MSDALIQGLTYTAYAVAGLIGIYFINIQRKRYKSLTKDQQQTLLDVSNPFSENGRRLRRAATKPINSTERLNHQIIINKKQIDNINTKIEDLYDTKGKRELTKDENEKLVNLESEKEGLTAEKERLLEEKNSLERITPAEEAPEEAAETKEDNDEDDNQFDNQFDNQLLLSDDEEEKKTGGSRRRKRKQTNKKETRKERRHEKKGDTKR